MKTDLDNLRRGVSELSDEKERLKLLKLIEETQEFDHQLEAERAEESEKERRLRRKGMLAIPFLLVAASGFMWYFASALSQGYIADRQQIISLSDAPINFWFLLFWPAAGFVACLVTLAYLVRFCFFRARNTCERER